MQNFARVESGWLQSPRTVALAAAACCCLTGCEAEKPQPTSPNSAAPSPGAAATASGEPNGAEAARSRPADDDRTRWLGDIPYDAFYDRPLEVYREGAPVESADNSSAPVNLPDTDSTVAAAVTSPNADSSKDNAPPSAPASAPSDVDWKTIAPIEVLADEVKAIRNRLSANLRTVATYNASYNAIETDGSVLALIAAIVERHPDKLSWTDSAAHVRQLAYDIYLNASGRGRTQFEATTAPFEKLIVIWDGGPPPDSAAESQTPLADTGDRAQIMSRIEQTFHWLRSDINTPSRMKDELERVSRETTLMAAFGTALADPGFDDADQEPYRRMLQQFVEVHLAMRSAAAADDFAAFEQARNNAEKSCTACHQEYRTGSSGG